MKIITYGAVLKGNIPVLVKERSVNYSDEEGITSPEKIVNMMNSSFKLNRRTEEYVYMVAFNNQMLPVGVFEISHGTVNASMITPREIFLRALLVGAVSIAIVHNHPSGTLNPSKEDINVYRRVKNSGEMLGISVVDSIIIGGKRYISMREDGIA